MHYSYEIDILTTHTVDAPFVYPIKLTAGILFNVDLLFEVGDGYSSCVILWDQANQILPSNPDGWYSADGLLIVAPCWYNLGDKGNDLYFIAWNRGGLHNHTVNVMLSVKDPAEPDMMSLIQAQNAIIERQISVLKGLM